MTIGPEGYRSTWVSAPQSALRFEADFGGERDFFGQPLTACYQYLAKTELTEGELLSLGIGTGQVELLARLDGRRITGIDVNQGFLSLASARLPGATMLRGQFQEILPQLQRRFPLALASESLDCVDPKVLPSVLSSIRKAADKLVVVQSFIPDVEYYAYNWPDYTEGSRSGPGLEGLAKGQIDRIIQVLTANGITATVSDPYNLLKQTQSFIESRLGGKLGVDITEVYDRIGLQYRNFKPERAVGRPYPSQILMFHSRAERWLAHVIDRFKSNIVTMEQVEWWITMCTAHRLAQIMSGALQTEYYFSTLEQALAQAGFSHIERKRVIAKEGQLSNHREMASSVARAMEYAKRNPPRFTNRKPEERSGLFAEGVPAAFYGPEINPFKIAQLRYIVAS